MKHTGLWVATSLLAACTQRSPTGTTAQTSCAARLAAGDLTITEVMANPSGTDTGKEWFEVRNHRAEAVDLAGLTLVAEKSDGTGAMTHIVKTQVIGANGFLVFGGAAATPMPVYMDYDYGKDLGALRNDDGKLVLRCDDVVVDEVVYASAPDGAALSFDGTSWCDATAAFDADDKGTPGQANPSCGGSSGATCADGGSQRAIVSPGAGDLVITEIMANPSKVSDEAGEWFEVAVLRDVDVNGLQIGTSPGTPAVTLSDAACRRRTAGTRLVFARSADAAKNGGLPAVEGTFSFGLSNSGGTLWVGVGGTVLDQTSWSRSTDGASLSLDPEHTDRLGNDDEASFCAATSTYGAGDRGTPGAGNDGCAGGPAAGKCLDGDTERDVVPPRAGDLVISELMVGQDFDRDWFEVTLLADVDLNGLALGPAVGQAATTIIDRACRRRSAGTALIFAHSADAGENGGLPAPEATVSFALDADGAIWVGAGTTTLDAVAWTGASAGAAWNLDPAKLDSVSNDAEASWCPATEPFGDGGKGSPGAANESCPPASGMCLDADGETERPIIAPTVGDLLVTEIMANAAGASESGKEWFEVHVGRDVDLAGLSVASGTKSTRYSATDCQRVAAGSFLVFANGTTDVAKLPRVDYVFDFTLVNSGSQLSLFVGGELLDAAVWTQATDGVSRTLKKSRFDTVSNDTAANFCNSTASYGDGTSHGTPGADDPSCS